MWQRTGNVSRFQPRSGTVLFIFPLLYAWHSPAGVADTVKVYRCTGKDGLVEFRQQYCGHGRQEQVQVDTTPSGWIPPRPKPEKRAVMTRSKTGRQGDSRAIELKQKQEKECWRVQKRLDKLQWRMRRGYKAGKGPGLRRQRRDYEDYLRKFC